MGRLAYTAATTQHLIAAAHDNDEALYNIAMNYTAGEESKNQAFAAAGEASVAASSSASTSREKDPHTWSQRAFNPDDESLPLVLEVNCRPPIVLAC